MDQIKLSSWKSTLIGCALAVVGVLEGIKQPTLMSAMADAHVQMCVAGAVLGYLSKDKDK